MTYSKIVLNLVSNSKFDSITFDFLKSLTSTYRNRTVIKAVTAIYFYTIEINNWQQVIACEYYLNILKRRIQVYNAYHLILSDKHNKNRNEQIEKIKLTLKLNQDYSIENLVFSQIKKYDKEMQNTLIQMAIANYLCPVAAYQLQLKADEIKLCCDYAVTNLKTHISRVEHYLNVSINNYFNKNNFNKKELVYTNNSIQEELKDPFLGKAESDYLNEEMFEQLL